MRENKGIEQEIKEHGVSVYSTLTQKGLMDNLKKLMVEEPHERKFVLHTGYHGMIAFDLTTQFGQAFSYVNMHKSKYCGMIFSLGKKHGNIKVVVKNHLMTIRNGARRVERVDNTEDLIKFLEVNFSKEEYE